MDLDLELTAPLPAPLQQVAAMEGGAPTIVTNAEGGRTTPSVVAYTKNGHRLVGQVRLRHVFAFYSHQRVDSQTSKSFFSASSFEAYGQSGCLEKTFAPKNALLICFFVFSFLKRNLRPPPTPDRAADLRP